MNNSTIEIQGQKIGLGFPTYFIADIAANHDGDLNRAKELIRLAAESGANAAKFQHFQAKSIVSDYGFKNLSGYQSHQSSWEKSVYEVYNDASVSLEWTKTLKETCDEMGIHFFSTPYALDVVEHLDSYVPAYKIGSGDITWVDFICYIASKGKPYLLATGASNLEDVKRAVDACIKINPNLCLMQCNTNYTNDIENFKFTNLNVLNLFSKMYPNVILGLSDHTPGHSAVLGAVTLGAKVIEKHFTDDNNRKGPDHSFALNPKTWREMVDRTIELEYALGSETKKIEANEKETVVIQRRAIRLKINLNKGESVKEEDISFLRPCPDDGIEPFRVKDVIGKKLLKSIQAGEHLKWKDLE